MAPASTFPRLIASTAAALLALAALTGCSVGIEREGGTAAGHDQTNQSDADGSDNADTDPDGSETDADGTDTATDDTDTSASTGQPTLPNLPNLPGVPNLPIGPGADEPTRAAYEDSVTVTLSCGPAPLEIDNVGDVIELSGDCADVTVSGTGAVILADRIGTLTVTGVANIVLVDTLDAGALDGTGNVVHWQSGTPNMSDMGVANTSRKAAS